MNFQYVIYTYSEWLYCYASAQCSVAGDISFCPVRPCVSVRPETLF